MLLVIELIVQFFYVCFQQIWNRFCQLFSILKGWLIIINDVLRGVEYGI